MKMRSNSRIGIARARTKSPAARRLLAGALACALLGGPALGAEFYVATDGNDRNAGSKEKPFATLERARDAVRGLSGAQRAGGATVWIRGGTYQRDRCFELNERDSGAGNGRIVYRGAPDEKVRIMGGRLIPPSEARPVTDPRALERIIETNARSAVLQIDLKKLGISDYGAMQPAGSARPYHNPPLELFIDDRPMNLARWPNSGALKLGRVLDQGSRPRNVAYKDMDDSKNRGGKFEYAGDRPDRWQQADDIWVLGCFAYTWAPEMLKVKAIDTEKKTIELAQAHLYALKGGHSGQTAGLSHHFLNLLEELDEPGEYYVDKKGGLLYFIPPAQIGPETRIAVSLLDDPVVALEGAGQVTIRDLTIEVSRGIGVYIERGSSNIVGGCTLCNLGMVGVCFGMGIEPAKYPAPGYVGQPISRRLGSLPLHEGEDTAFDRKAGAGHGLIGCDIYNTGRDGISLSGGDRKTLTPGGNQVRNCRIHHYPRLRFVGASGVAVTGVGNSIAHCLIHDSPYAAISYHGNELVFEFNEITRCATLSDDLGAIVTGRDPSVRGNIIRCNFIHDVGYPQARWAGSHAIMLDDGNGGEIIVSNVFYRAGNPGGGSHGVIDHNGGGGSAVENNIFAQCPSPLCGWTWDARRWSQHINKPVIKKRILENVDITKPPYSVRYPELAEISRWHKWPNSFKNNIVTSDLKQFVDAKTLNFKLKEDAAVLKATPGFKPIPFERIGLYRDEYRKTTPAK